MTQQWVTWRTVAQWSDGCKERAPWEEHGTNDRLHEADLLSCYTGSRLGGLGMRVLRRNMCVWHV